MARCRNHHSWWAWPLTALSLALGVGLAPRAAAQTEAQLAVAEGRQALLIEDWEKAIQSLERAAETDPENPDVFLLLGRAHYRAGHLDEAVAAWRRTLELAPEQSEARQMLDALLGREVDVERSLRLVEQWLDQERDDAALSEIGRLSRLALSEEQRVRLRFLEARSQFAKDADTSLTILERLALEDPAFAAEPDFRLLAARARLQTKSQRSAALEDLHVLAAESSVVAASARLELLLDRANHHEFVLDELVAWLEGAGSHPRRLEAARAVTGLCFDRSTTLAPTLSSTPSPLDPVAARSTAELANADPRAKVAVDAYLDYVERRYRALGLPALAADSLGHLLEQTLPPVLRERVLGVQAADRVAVFQQDVHARLGATGFGSLGGTPPDSLDTALETIDLWRATTLGPAPVRMRESLAQDLAELAAPADAPRFPPHEWAIMVLKPLLDSGRPLADPALEILAGLAERHATSPLAERRRRGAEWRELRHAVFTEPSERAKDALAVAAAWRLTAEAALGERTPARLTDDAEHALVRLLEAASEQARSEQAMSAQSADAVFAEAARLLAPWQRAFQDAEVQRVYEALESALPDPAKRRARLAIAQLRLDRVRDQDLRNLAAGNAAAPSLSDPVREALVALEEAQRELPRNHAIVLKAEQLRAAWLEHCLSLERDDLARASLEIAATPAVPGARRAARARLLALSALRAREDLERRSLEHDGLRTLELTSAFEALLGECSALVGEDPDSAKIAVAQMFAVAELYRSMGRPAVAVEVYQRIATLAREHDSLAAPNDVESGVESRAALSRAIALIEEGRALDTDPRKTAESAELADAAYDRALGALQEIRAAHRDRPEAKRALDAAVEIGRHYAELGRWQRADAVFAKLLEDDGAVYRPERFEFARALCALGPVLADHARVVLCTLFADVPADTALLEEPEESIEEADSGSFLSGRGVAARAPAAPGSPGPTTGTDPASQAPELALRSAIAMNAAAQRDLTVLSAMRQQQAEAASRIAAREGKTSAANSQSQTRMEGEFHPVSAAEIERQRVALERAMELLLALRAQYADTTTAAQARAEMLILARHWSTLGEWQRTAKALQKYLEAFPRDPELVDLRWERCEALSRFAEASVAPGLSRELALQRASERFEAARAAISEFGESFADRPELLQRARWALAQSSLTEARVVQSIGPTLARGRYARAVQGFLDVARSDPDIPECANVPQIVWGVIDEMVAQGFHDEAIAGWGALGLAFPLHPLTDQATLRIAQTYQSVLGQPLRAAEAYLELNFGRGGDDADSQEQLLGIAASLESQKRWVEALHVLETFVDSFPGTTRAPARR